ncbi:hypothetical protein [Pontibacter beigongshangensis]|uniref:hypothetical protein n=1 Tax=Pontibacter beigongshangensis TaxID=2574733 RepID=UPI00164FE588|nr:hypothetical protein [Pontibacter beigongshangensis]
MTSHTNPDTLLRTHLVELLTGGFAPNVILLREFQFEKAAVMLNGLHFSAWVLLGHMRARQQTLLRFMQDPQQNQEVWLDAHWLDAHWPENHQPASEQEWQQAIDAFEKELQEMILIVQDPERQLFEVHPNGKTLAWAAITALHHNSYHIGQLKTIGRQLGVW